MAKQTQTGSSTTQTGNTGDNRETLKSQNQQTGTQKSAVFTPVLDSLIQRAQQNAAQGTIPTYDRAGLNQATQNALGVLQAGRSQAGIQSVLDKYKAQAASLANAPTDISSMANQFRNYGQEADAKQRLQDELNAQQGRDIAQLNRNAVGRGNTASSRTAITESLTRESNQKAYAQGASNIEAQGYSTAMNMAGNVWNQQQAAMSNNLAAQGAIEQNLANWQQTDAQTAVNAGKVLQAEQQGVYDVNRSNQLIQGNQALAQLNGLTGTMTALGGLNVAQTQNTTGSDERQSNLQNTGYDNTQYQAPVQQQGSGLTWGGLASSVGGAVASKAAEAVANKASGWITSWL